MYEYWFVWIPLLLVVILESRDGGWFPFRSHLARDVFFHMDVAEKRRLFIRVVLVGALWGLSCGGLIAVGIRIGGIGGILGTVLVAAFSWWLLKPGLVRYFQAQLASTFWAREHGLRPDQIVLY